jgi:hypothetical protein
MSNYASTAAASFCASCGAPASPGGAFCASCGTRLTATPDIFPSTEQAGPAPSKGGLLTLIIIAIVGAGLALVLYAMSSISALRSAPAVPPDANEQLGAQGVTIVKAGLRDPVSAIFSNVRGNADEGCAYGTVNAKNGFGGYSGTDDYVVRQGAVTFKSGGLIPYMEVTGDCEADGATKQLKTETDPKMRALLQNVIEAHRKAVATGTRSAP